MRAYELMIIFEGDLGDDAVKAMLDRVGQQVESLGGRVATTDVWGARRFAYEIDHKNEGIYVVLDIVTDESELGELDRLLRLADDVVRHKLIRLPIEEATRRGLLEQAAPAEAG